ncbi:rhamnogalacturonan acetylesterase [Tamlana sp. s12]|uniref:rhamnogalacturonan acetylesterase n=1 Tax=Tamlana sp. s12 TaxID=1630406 RepID=UPI0007FCEFB5|nr:rhamnogalacturonan acetylesterase [Tamlana sp. s12]OBQ52213.1 rhamnogalacturonan acetylesterase [Tamlana sp. s12]QQY82322.1 rhamnogalacturonan acetylesterase [Tamlana sp. s12]
MIFLKLKQYVLALAILFSVNGFAQNTTIYMIGDSTMANKKNPDENPEHGWGQVLPSFFKDGITIENRAVNGRSSKSFRAEGRWDAILKTLKKGDYVFIQFGHNDQKEKSPERYTNPHTTYRHNLINYVLEAREKGAIPVLFSSIVRRNFNEEGVFIDTHGAYPLEVRLVASEYHVPFIDLQYETEILETSYGVEKSKLLHLHFEAGTSSYYKEAKHDDTHLSKLGATEVAKLAVAELKKNVPDISKLLK